MGGATPALLAIGRIFRIHDATFRRDVCYRAIDIRRVDSQSYLILFALLPLLYILGGGLDRLLGGDGLHLAARFQNRLWSILPFADFSLFLDPSQKNSADVAISAMVCSNDAAPWSPD